MIDLMLPLPGLSPVSGKTVVAKFDGGLLSSDGGILVLREIEQRLRVADRLRTPVGSEFAVRVLVRANVEATDCLPNSCRPQSAVQPMSEWQKHQVGIELSLLN